MNQALLFEIGQHHANVVRETFSFFASCTSGGRPDPATSRPSSSHSWRWRMARARGVLFTIPKVVKLFVVTADGDFFRR